MTKTSLLFFSAFLLSSQAALAAGPATPGDVTDQQIAGFKTTMDTSCRDAGKKHGDAATHVDAVCGCLHRVMEENVTMQNWRQAYYEDSQGHQAEVQKLLTAPNADKLRACAALP